MEETIVEAWMYEGMGFTYVLGALRLAKGRLAFLVSADPGEKAAAWLQERTGAERVRERVAGGETVAAIEVAVAEAKPSSPFWAFGSTITLHAGERRLRFSFYSPAGRNIVMQLSGISQGKPLRQALKRG